jgi:hypothetical protein
MFTIVAWFLQILVTDSTIPSVVAPATNVSLATTPLAPPLEDKVLSWMYAGSNDDYGGQPMTRLGASLKALLWGLFEYELAEISEIIIVEWTSVSVTQHICDSSEMDVICRSDDKECGDLSTSEASFSVSQVLLRVLAVNQEQTMHHVHPPLTRMSEVHALNAAAQRARGAFLLRLDQDTLVGPSFMRFLRAEMFASWPHIHQPWFGGRRDCDEQTSPLITEDPVAFLLTEDDTVSSWAGSDSEHKMGGPVGVLGLPAWLWRAIRGYDESYIAWGHMELEMYNRLTYVAEVLPLSRHTDMSIPFYHLAHNKSSLTEPTRHENSFHESIDRLGVSKVNSKTWGLASMNIPETLLNVCRFRPAGDIPNNTA